MILNLYINLHGNIELFFETTLVCRMIKFIIQILKKEEEGVDEKHKLKINVKPRKFNER